MPASRNARRLAAASTAAVLVLVAAACGGSGGGANDDTGNFTYLGPTGSPGGANPPTGWQAVSSANASPNKPRIVTVVCADTNPGNPSRP